MAFSLGQSRGFSRIYVWTLGLSFVVFVLNLYYLYQNRAATKVLNGLVDNYKSVIDGNASFNGHLIDLETKLAQFEGAISYLPFLTTECPKWYVHRKEIAIGKWIHSIISVTFGWWSVFGFLVVIGCLIKSISFDGDSVTVR